MECPKGHYLSGLMCSKSFCSQKRLLCAVPTNNKWVATGPTYYSHCFTGGGMTWDDWWADLLNLVPGQKRVCGATQPDAMPDRQSCGDDGIVVGLHCRGL